MSGHFDLDRVYQKFRGDDNRRKESRRCVEQPQARLFADVCKVAKIPRDEIVDLVKRCERDMDGVGDVFSVKDAAIDITFGKNCDLICQLELFERFHEVQISTAVRLGHSLEFPLDKDRTASTIFRQFVFPPANSQISAKRLAVIEIGTDNGCF